MSTISRVRTVSAEGAAGIALGVTVFCMVLGSSSVAELVGPGRKLRWIALLALAAIAVAVAVRDRTGRPERPTLAVFAVGGSFIALAAVSSLWSVDPRLTFARAVSLSILFVAAAALALVARSRPRTPEHLLRGILGGAAAAALGGLPVLALRHDDAVQAATALSPVRFRGLGENPDTVSMLAGIAVPIGLWLLVRAHGRLERWSSVGILALLLGTIVASGSRGALLATLVGGVALSLAVPASRLRRVLHAGVVVAVVLLAAALSRLPQPPAQPASSAPPATASTPASSTRPVTTSSTGPVTTSSARPVTTPSTRPVATKPPPTTGTFYASRLADELDRGQDAGRSLFTSSGRFQAWTGAIHQADARPLLGYGFGTEAKVFVDRFYSFEGSYVENSLIGVYLQLGAIGLLSFLGLLAAIVLAGRRALARDVGADGVGPPFAAVVAAGVALLFVQSYAYSVGNIATVTFWISAFMVAGVGGMRAQEQVEWSPAQKRAEVARA